jgi:hypothetical protein
VGAELNDAYSAHPAPSFLAADEQIVRDTRAALPDALVVLVGPYWNPPHDVDAFTAHIAGLRAAGSDAKAAGLEAFAASHFIGPDFIDAYLERLPRIAADHSAIYVDLYPVLEGAPWLVHGDAVHFNDVGQQVIGFTVFTEIARRCSFIAAEVRGPSRS